jgi:GntR family transcriptional regulator
MFFTIEPDNGLAIYDQIVRQVKFAVASGALAPGQLVPSLRELAGQLALNPNTVARAYRDLQAEGILDMVRGTGLEVSSKAPKACRLEREKLIRERLRSVLGEARQSQLAEDDLRTMFSEELTALAAASPSKSKNR